VSYIKLSFIKLRHDRITDNSENDFVWIRNGEGWRETVRFLLGTRIQLIFSALCFNNRIYNYTVYTIILNYSRITFKMYNIIIDKSHTATMVDNKWVRFRVKDEYWKLETVPVLIVGINNDSYYWNIRTDGGVP